MRARLPLIALSTLLLAACSSGPVKRVSPPQASISQLTVLADGQWQLELRLQNFSTMAMRFDSVQLDLRNEQELLARLEAQPAFSVGAESGDLHRLTVQPTAQRHVAGIT